MSAAAKLADVHEMLAPPERLSALFHMVNRLLPDDQVMLSVSPETPARGAQRGYLLLLKEGTLCIESSSAVDTGERRYRPSIPVETADDLPASIVHYVTRTKELLTIEDAVEDSRFSGDAVVRRTRSRSVLCVPITTRGDTVGVLYLEHNLVSGAFTSRQSGGRPAAAAVVQPLVWFCTDVSSFRNLRSVVIRSFVAV